MEESALKVGAETILFGEEDEEVNGEVSLFPETFEYEDAEEYGDLYDVSVLYEFEVL